METMNGASLPSEDIVIDRRCLRDTGQVALRARHMPTGIVVEGGPLGPFGSERDEREAIHSAIHTLVRELEERVRGG